MHVRHLISHICLYPLYCVHVHPTSLFLVHNTTIITKIESYVIALYLSIEWIRVDTMNSIRYIQHPLRMGYLWLILIMSGGPLYVPSASSRPPYTIDCQLPTLPDRGNILSSGHISTFVS